MSISASEEGMVEVVYVDLEGKEHHWQGDLLEVCARIIDHGKQWEGKYESGEYAQSLQMLMQEVMGTAMSRLSALRLSDQLIKEQNRLLGKDEGLSS